ncbi:MAG: hypothetical protein OES46_08190 [Gammaproteobacteria bacterium]|nr:hypothetical protein [Gammaproteobacteria bacterium]
MRTTILSGLILLCAVSCSSNRGSRDILDHGLTECAQPRPEVCTREYVPVCGRRAGREWKTYSNACTACSDYGVVGYKPNACG